MPSQKPEVKKRFRDKWYHNNKDKQIQRQLDRRREMLDWLWEFKRTLSCTDCNCSFKEHPEWLDFHHLDPAEKEGSLRLMVLCSRKKLMEELKKCVPLCANCHRTRHRGERSYGPVA